MDNEKNNLELDNNIDAHQDENETNVQPDSIVGIVENSDSSEPIVEETMVEVETEVDTIDEPNSSEEVISSNDSSSFQPEPLLEEINIDVEEIDDVEESKPEASLPVPEVEVKEKKQTPVEKNLFEEDAVVSKLKTGHKRIMQGKVTSNKMDKTIVVTMERYVKHPIYKKYYKRTKKLMAHDAENTCNIGDIVKVREHKPISARKRWEMIEIVERAK